MTNRTGVFTVTDSRAFSLFWLQAHIWRTSHTLSTLMVNAVVSKSLHQIIIADLLFCQKLLECLERKWRKQWVLSKVKQSKIGRLIKFLD